MSVRRDSSASSRARNRPRSFPQNCGIESLVETNRTNTMNSVRCLQAIVLAKMVFTAAWPAARAAETRQQPMALSR